MLFHFETLTSYFYCVRYFKMNINGGECSRVWRNVALLFSKTDLLIPMTNNRD